MDLTHEGERKKRAAVHGRRGEAGRRQCRNLLDVSDSTRLVAIITKESAENLDVRVGDNACALIKASHIILAVD